MDNQPPILLRNLRDGRGRRLDAVVARGRLYLKGWPADGMPSLDCSGGLLMRGLTDHHVHLMATAAAHSALDLSGVEPDSEDLALLLQEAARDGPVRAIGLDGAERLDATGLERLVRDVPVRIQARTGGLWVLNRSAIAEIELGSGGLPPAFEREGDGRPTGRVWRGDGCLRLPGAAAPDLRALGAELARWGVTSVVDASVTTDDEQAAAIAAAGLPQRLTLMSGGSLAENPGWRRGPVKIVLDEHAPPAFEELATMIDGARLAGRNVAVHCVTHAELALALAALDDRGAEPGDRIEHGAMIAPEAIPEIARHGLIVVSNPGFIAGRGERYRRQIPPADQPDLYRLDSLRRAGIALAAGSDAPYGPLDPWTNMRAACDRRTAAGIPIGIEEALAPEAALALFTEPCGRGLTALRDGDTADIVVLAPGMRPGVDLDPVALTVIGGRVVYRRPAAVAARDD